MITCFNCGRRYEQETTPNSDFMFCSSECFEQDELRLVEGNGIIEAAEKAEHGFTDINKLKLDVHAPAASKAVQDMKQLNNMLGFNRKRDDNNDETPDDAA